MTYRGLLFGLALFATPTMAQRPVPATVVPSAKSTNLTAEQRKSAIAEVEAALRKSYVFPERVGPILQALDTSLKAGRYDVASAPDFAERITADLRASSKDRHLYLSFDPARHAAALADNDQGGSEQSDSYDRRQFDRDHDGLVELKILPGNVRYLKISGFEWTDDTSGAAYDDAMRFLRGGDALIIDLRGNGGGSHGAVRYLVSHFLEPGTLELTFLEAGKPPTQSRALEYLPAGRLRGKPLYVLIDNSTGSAAEAFAYDVQQFHLGELVGAKTGGAANNNRFEPIAPEFMLSVSFGRPVHAVSNTNWEGTGVQPSVAAEPMQALDVAHDLALKRLVQRTDAPADDRADWQWALVAAEAKLHPPAISAAHLAKWAGNYGPGRVAFKDGFLWLTWRDYPVERMYPLTSDGLFGIEGVDALRLRFLGQALEMHRANEPAPRTYPKS